MFLSKKAFYLKHTKDYCYSAYITYEDELSANLAIAGLNNFMFEGKKMEASFATNKYCQKYLHGKRCSNRQCNFIHEEMPLSECFIKERSLDNRDIFQSQKTYAYNAIKGSKPYTNTTEVGQENPQCSEPSSPHTLIGGNGLPSMSDIIRKVKLYYKEREVQTLRSATFDNLSEITQKRQSAFDKIRRLTDCEEIVNCLDYRRAELDLIRRSRGDYYRFNAPRRSPKNMKCRLY